MCLMFLLKFENKFILSTVHFQYPDFLCLNYWKMMALCLNYDENLIKILQENLKPDACTIKAPEEVSSFTCGRNFSYCKYGLVSANLMSREL